MVWDGRLWLLLVMVVATLANGEVLGSWMKPDIEDPLSRAEGPMTPLDGQGRSPGPGAVILANVPADYDWWNGCSPTAGGMLMGWWDEAGYEVFPGNHRNLPPTYPNTSTLPANYTDARGIIAGWAHKEEGMAHSLTYGSPFHHAPDSIADFILTYDGSTDRSDMAHGLETFAAWDDPRTAAIESQRFSASTVYTFAGWSYANYCAQIDAGRPVHLGLSSDKGGHSVLGVGYNNTGGKENVVLLTTWHWGLQEWEWEDETVSGNGYSVYGATLMDAVPGETPELSGYFSIAHTYIGDLTVELGVGNPSDPDWSSVVWDGFGSADNLVMTDIDCTDLLDDLRSGDLQWYLKVYDGAGGDVGTIEDFQIRYKFDEIVYDWDEPPVPISDFSYSYAYLTTARIPEPSTLLLAIAAIGSLILARRFRKA
jgi:hypothetical protein